MPSTLLITGGSGLLALNWAASRMDRDHVWLGLNSRQINLDGAYMLQLSGDFNAAIETVKPDMVIHTAAMTNVDACEAQEKQAIAVNCALAKDAAKAAHRHALPFIHISTDHLFSGRQAMVDETATCLPLNIYGHSKLLGERAVALAHPSALILRVNFFGWGPKYRPSFSDWVINNLSSGKPITLYNNVFITPLYVGEVIDYAHQLLDAKAQGVYNISSSDRISKYDFGMRLAEAFDLEMKLISKDSYNTKMGAPRPLDMSLSNKKICGRLGIKEINLNQSIEKLCADKERQKIFFKIDAII
ncbi:SDR family oxidoreductase [Alphaproteobacteria bacterium]|nr:SDR family oxidoreductase [Alphaproteobacteria bacterium]